jgi:glycosyltransferase involved in cell wall biosynthesis
MRPSVLFFFPHCPVPPRSGAHERCLAELAALRELGCRVLFFGSRHTSEREWSRDAIAELEDHHVDSVVIYEPSRSDRLALRLLPRFYRILHCQPPLASLLHAPPAMRHVFRRVARAWPADVTFVNYAFWNGLVAAGMRRRTVTAIEVHDLVTLTGKMLRAIAAPFSGQDLSVESVSSDFLREDFFARLNLAPDVEEIEIYARYRYVITICPSQTATIHRGAPATEVIEVPATDAPVALDNAYAGPPCFVTGPNLLNVQGYVYFAREILPRVAAAEPGFMLDVTGAVCDRVSAVPGIRLAGTLPSLTDLYRRARFAISPVLGTTGQQIKIVQAMAHGLPVVAMRQAAEGSPLQHGVNGFLCDDAPSFARHVLDLWRDRELCRAMGERARATVTARFTPGRFTEELRPLVECARERRGGRRGRTVPADAAARPQVGRVAAGERRGRGQWRHPGFGGYHGN